MFGENYDGVASRYFGFWLNASGLALKVPTGILYLNVIVFPVLDDSLAASRIFTTIILFSSE